MQRLLFLLLLVLALKAESQTADENPLKFDIIPPGPEAASLGKFVDNPVSAYTGVPSINIPIYTLKSYELSLPVSLSYHASGLKWEEIPSWVGAGWALNAGGTVSRTIRGRNDEDPDYGYFLAQPAMTHNIPSFFSGSTFDPQNFDYVVNNCSNGYTSDQYRDVLYASRGGLDLEPDQFFFSLPDGQSGKFIFSRDQQMRLFPHQFATITHSPHPTSGKLFDKWMITGKDGTKYFFERQEMSTSQSSCKVLPDADDDVLENQRVPDVEAVSSWKLVRMESANGNDHIEFAYSPETYTYRTRMSTTSYDQISGTVQVPGASYCWNYVTYQGWRLKEITTKSGYKVEFIANTNRADLPGSKWLDSINVSYKDELIKKFALSYSGPIPTLAMLQEFFDASGTVKNPPYEFTYYQDAPGDYSRESENLDHWGYSNGSSNSVRFTAPILDNINNVYYAGADRQANLEACRWMTLKQIRYPTGGTLNYEYELNDFSNLPPNLNFDHLSQLELIESIEFTVTNNVLPMAYQTKPFTLTENTPVVMFFIPATPGGGIPVTGLHATLSKSSGDPFTTIKFESGQTQEYSSLVQNLTAGNYTLYGEFKDGVYDLGNQPFYVKVYRIKDTPTLIEAGEMKGGGLRIRKITSVGDNTYTKTYSYVSSATGKSSGKLMTFPTYTYFQEFNDGYMDPVYGNCVMTNTGTVLVRANSPTVSLGVTQGAHVGYSEVTEYFGDATSNNGYTVYTFTNTPDIQDGLFPFVPSQSSSYKNGLALTTKVFTSDDKLVQETNNTYNYEIDSWLTIHGVKVAQAKSTGRTGCLNRTFTYHVYSEPTERVRLAQTTTRQYNTADNTYNEKTVTYDYNTFDQISLTKESTSFAGRERVTTIDYHNVNHTAITKKTSYYATDSVGPVEYEKGHQITYNSLLKPEAVSILEPPGEPVSEEPTTYVQRLHYTHFDEYGNVTSLVRDGLEETRTSYIWSYDGLFPIAQVINAHPDEIAYTSFENANEGGWTYGSPNDADNVTGKRSYDLDSGDVQTKDQLAPGDYIVSYFANGPATLLATTVDTDITDEFDAESQGEWTFYRKKVHVTNGATELLISGTGLIDELRLHPADARMSTYCYDPKTGVTHVTDANNFTTTYDYDDHRRLEFIRDFEENVVKRFDYHYKLDN